MKDLSNPTNKDFNGAGVRFEIPDLPPKEQLAMAKRIREVMVTFAKAAGEEDGLDLSDMDIKVAELEKQIASEADNAK